ncbi:Retrovirus-related Pol polyprotein [Thelohanellus kitauei]|uniref:Retrovirus-related Pol polyprotein n=1 Tax=Thelohanellus kitauei TaxID=669202 RepID=A0A0C2MYN3_THEKT|nr:Retrovirus-related Pol polyprotein [Thelohanellus kitauei]
MQLLYRYLFQVDFTGPLPLTRQGNRYIICFIDHYSKWLEAIAVPNQIAELAAKALFSCVISRYGVPSKIISDQGTQFESLLFHHMCQMLGCEKLRTTPYHPATNGLVERANKSMKELLRTCVNEFGNDWDEKLDLVLYALRSAKHESTHFSPAKIVLGQDIKLPVDLELPLITSQRSQRENYHVFVNDLILNLQNICKVSDEHLNSSQRKLKCTYDKKRYEIHHAVGDHVLLMNREGSKMEKKFEGPFVVTDANHPVYKIAEMFYPNKPTKKVNHNLLYPCRGHDSEPKDQLNRSYTTEDQAKNEKLSPPELEKPSCTPEPQVRRSRRDFKKSVRNYFHTSSP